MIKRNITLRLKVQDARNVFYHLRDTFSYNPERDQAVRKTAAKLQIQINKTDAINTTKI